MVMQTLAVDGSAAVAAPTDRVQRLGALLGDDDRVALIDMTQLGANPARIIPAWRDLADRALATGAPFLGVGEPVWAGRSEDELDECHRHEALINVAFGDDPAWRLVCPYDVDGLEPAVTADARSTHPTVHDGGHTWRSRVDGRAAFLALERPLSAVPDDAVTMAFDRRDLVAIRSVAVGVAERVGLSQQRTGDLLVAVTEAVANSICHGGGPGMLSVWHRREAVVCQVADSGQIADIMVGRRRPVVEHESGRGVWIMHQLCDLVQIRSSQHGTVVRLTISR
jgi:anti-sigma regulatory factor (Ser/Thr protein kinase)